MTNLLNSFDDLWMKSKKILLLALLCMVALAIGYFLLLKNPIEELNRLKNYEKKLKINFALRQQAAAQLNPYRQQLLFIDKKVKTILAASFGPFKTPIILEEISKAALHSKVRLQWIQPQSKVTNGFYTEQAIQMAIIGDYLNLLVFMNKIMNINPTMVMEALTLSKDQEEVLILMSVTAKLYLFNF